MSTANVCASCDSLRQSVDVNLDDKKTPLDMAAENRHTEIVSFLRTHGVSEGQSDPIESVPHLQPLLAGAGYVPLHRWLRNLHIS
jgi:ankyrin repeat protein